MSSVLVTGATGFVGKALTIALVSKGFDVTAVVRNPKNKLPLEVKQVIVSDISGLEEDALKNIDCIIHLVARVHVMKEHATNSRKEYRKSNTDATLRLAKQASKSGVKRFIFLSSIKVNGEFTTNFPFTADDTPKPEGDYAKSKHEAEIGLQKIAKETKLDIVIIRPPLIYGEGVKANFLTMMKWLNKGIPLPLGSIRNKRSLVSLDNLVDFIRLCIKHPAASNQVFLVSDGEDLSTTELLIKLKKTLTKPAKLIIFPVILLKITLLLFGKRSISQRLFRSLQLDTKKSKERLSWTPLVSVDEALKKTVLSYLNSNKR